MNRRPVVHVVSRGRFAIGRALSQQLQQEAVVSLWDAVPPLSKVVAEDIALVVVADLPRVQDPDRLRGLLDHSNVWLVVEDGLGYSDVIRSMSHAPAHVMPFTPADRESGFPRLAEAFAARLRRPSPDTIADLVLSQEPVLKAVEALVRAICLQSKEIRRPRDLAIACGMRLATLKAQVAKLGFTRVEHFIVCVRAVAYEQIVGRLRLPSSAARRILGITDVSNYRRELARAHERSSKAFGQFASFKVMLLLGFVPSLVCTG